MMAEMKKKLDNCIPLNFRISHNEFHHLLTYVIEAKFYLSYRKLTTNVRTFIRLLPSGR